MTERNPTVDFFVGLRKIDKSGLKARDVIALWAIRQTPGMMGRELALKIGLNTRSNIQDAIARLTMHGLIEDRRKTRDNRTPNDLHILPAGTVYLDDVIPA